MSSRPRGITNLDAKLALSMQVAGLTQAGYYQREKRGSWRALKSWLICTRTPPTQFRAYASGVNASILKSS